MSKKQLVLKCDVSVVWTSEKLQMTTNNVMVRYDMSLVFPSRLEWQELAHFQTKCTVIFHAVPYPTRNQIGNFKVKKRTLRLICT